jgi:RNA polymerase sigma-70 factor (ECF subfamily)
MTGPSPQDDEKKLSLDAMMPLIYRELRQVAASMMHQERASHTLQPTALVNETYLRLLKQHSVDFANRGQVLGIAAQMMRRILCTHEEARRTEKRGGDVTIICLEDSAEPASAREISFSTVDQILDRLGKLDQRQAAIAELRIFGGLTVEESAEFLAISPATVSRSWSSAKLWITRELRPPNPARSTTSSSI